MAGVGLQIVLLNVAEELLVDCSFPFEFWGPQVTRAHQAKAVGLGFVNRP